jgi:uncharacterized RDD family membrane protein YckC
MFDSQITERGDMHSHTRSLRRRFFATLFDWTIFAFLFAIVTAPFAMSLQSNFRAGFGVFHFNRCGPGEFFTETGKNIDTAGWDGVQICDTTVDFLFPYRNATIYKKTKVSVSGVETDFTRYITFELNDQSRVAYPVIVTSYLMIAFVVFVSICETFFGRTPGKKILGLSVYNTSGGELSILQAMLRNAIKYSAYLIWSVWAITTTPQAEAILKKALQADGKIVMPIELTDPGFLSNLPVNIGLSVLAILVMLSVPLSLFIPWKTAGRGLHDRAARSVVVY